MQSRSSGTRSSESFYTFAFIFLAAISALQLYIERHQSFTLLFVFGIAFIALLWLAFEQQISFREILIIGLSARAITFFGLPTLSDDLYRFIWDGFLLQEGLSPYALIPSDVV
ncbi:MAG: alpha-1,6-mannosyltransferase, partial [Cellvibrionaceae bacterium]